MEEAGGKMKGRYVQPINPDIWQDDTMAHTTYIFMKTELQELTASLIVTIGIQGLNKLPKVECMPTYPYQRSTGKYSHFQESIGTDIIMPFNLDGSICFVGEMSGTELSIQNPDNSTCLICNTHLDISKMHHILTHMGAHILFDGQIGNDDEHCGLCLCPATQCVFKVKHQTGNKCQINLHSSLCAHIPKDMSKQTLQFAKTASPTS